MNGTTLSLSKTEAAGYGVTTLKSTIRVFSARLISAVWLALPATTFAANLVIQTVPTITDKWFLPDAQPQQTEPAAISLLATPGEYEAAQFAVWSDTDIAGATLRISELSGPAGKIPAAAANVRIVKRWYQLDYSAHAGRKSARLVSELLLNDEALVKVENGANFLRIDGQGYQDVSTGNGRRGAPRTLAPDARQMPVFDASTLQPFALSSSANKLFWLTVQVPEGTAPGLYSGEIELLDAGKQLGVVPVSVEVMPFTLAAPMLDYSIYYRGFLKRSNDHGTISSEGKSRAQMAWDFANMQAHGVNNPNVYQKYPTGLLSKVLEMREEAGMGDQPLFYLGGNTAMDAEANVPPDMIPNVKGTLKLARKYKLPEVYFFGRDEVKGGLLLAQQDGWNEIKRRGGKIFAAGWHTTQSGGKGNFDLVGGAQDIAVSITPVLQSEADNWHSVGSKIYSYRGGTGGFEFAETFRRTIGLFLWQKEYDGAMLYGYQDSFGFAWNDFDGKDRNFVYPTADGGVDTVQWEAHREGVDDVRYLSTLLQLIETNLNDAANRATALAAQQWLAQLKEQPLAPLDLDQVRRQMAGYILALQGFDDGSDEQPVITGVRLDPVDSGGNSVVRWRSNRRVSGRVEGLPQSTQVPALLYEQAVPVAGISPGERYSISVYATAADGNEVVTTLDFDSSTGIEVQDTGVKSVWRTSAFVDDGSLIGWWRFSDDATDVPDSAGSEIEAEIQGDLSIVPGKFGNGVEFGEGGGLIYASDVEIPEGGAGTIEGWFRFDTTALENMGKLGLFNGLYQHPVNNNFYMQGKGDWFNVQSMVSVGNWHYIAMTWDGDVRSAVVYIDGRGVAASVAKKNSKMSEVDGLTIGRSSGYFSGILSGGGGSFDGAVDEIRVWSRALSADEIRFSYEGGRLRLPEGMQTRAIGAANATDESVYKKQ